MRSTARLLAITSVLTLALLATLGVPSAQQGLPANLTPQGGEKAGNAAGTIPA
jgi:hypothetical protein